MTATLQTEGKDEFLDTASRHGLTYVDYNDDFGSPMKYRVGRHLEGAKEVISWANDMQLSLEGKEVIVSWPGYNDLMEKDCGYFLKNPATANPDLVFQI